MSAKCIYCKALVGSHMGGLVSRNEAKHRRCFDAYPCRYRMRDRERRIVRVFWRVVLVSPNGGKRTIAEDFKREDALVEYEIAGIGAYQHDCVLKFCRVTVRRKAKS